MYCDITTTSERPLLPFSLWLPQSFAVPALREKLDQLETEGTLNSRVWLPGNHGGSW